MSSVEIRVSSKLPRGQWLCLQQTGDGISLLEVVAINSTIEPPELTQVWGNRLLEGTNRTCVHQDPGERSSDPTRHWPRLADVSRSLQQRRGSAVACCKVEGTECSSALLKNVDTIFITSTIVWPQLNNREGTQPHLWTENWIKCTEHGSAYQSKTQFPPQSVSPIRKFP